jgi:hypothetical protein
LARPRVFVSSTFYDLKYLRASIRVFIETLGYDAILNERGDIPYEPNVPLDISCNREAEIADIYVLIIGGRYGSETSNKKAMAPTEHDEFYRLYESITRSEYRAAVARDVPAYILIEKSVHGEYRTFQKNRDSENVKYAHVDSVNVFHFIQEILGMKANNPIQTFDKYSDIEEWLREQWAGQFHLMLKRKSNEAQIASLTERVAELAELNATLKDYLENIVRNVSKDPKQAEELIKNENQRLTEAETIRRLEKNGAMTCLRTITGKSLIEIAPFVAGASTLQGLIGCFPEVAERLKLEFDITSIFGRALVRELNEVRDDFHAPPFPTIPYSAKSSMG